MLTANKQGQEQSIPYAFQWPSSICTHPKGGMNFFASIAQGACRLPTKKVSNSNCSYANRYLIATVVVGSFIFLISIRWIRVPRSLLKHSLRFAPGTVRQCGSLARHAHCVLNALGYQAVVFACFRKFKYCFEVRCSCLVVTTRYWEYRHHCQAVNSCLLY